MRGIRFTWRREKAKGNLLKHGVTFALASGVFLDPYLLIVEDCIDESGEMRYHAMGYCNQQTLAVVVFVDRSTDEEEIIHIVSARKADKHDESTYTDQFA